MLVYVYNFKPPKNESFWFENSWNGSENRLVPILVIQRLAPTWWLSRVLSMTTKQKFDKWMPKHVIMMARKWGPIKYIQTYWHVMTRACSFLFSSMTGNSGGSSKTRRMNVWGSSFPTGSFSTSNTCASSSGAAVTSAKTLRKAAGTAMSCQISPMAGRLSTTRVPVGEVVKIRAFRQLPLWDRPQSWGWREMASIG